MVHPLALAGLALPAAVLAAVQGAGAQQVATAGAPQARAATPSAVPGNVLVILIDDVGVDKIGTYGEHPGAPATPTLDILAGEGVLFRNAYSYPICSPTRAAILTGRHAFRTGISNNVNYAKNVWALPFGEVTLPELIELGAGGRYANALVGKWHLGSAAWGSEQHPFLQGWQRHRGVQTNFGPNEGYYDWTKWVGGVAMPGQSTYVTTDQVDDAIDLASNLPQPWFVMLSLTAAHTPFHAPPQHLHTYSLSGDPELTPVEHFDAAVQAVDTELGRLLATVPAPVLDDTTVLLLGDNGAPGLAVEPPSVSSQTKGTLYEGAVNVPFVAWGKGVTARGAECGALVSVVDLFSTVAELCGVDARATLPKGTKLDSVSLVPYFTNPDRPPLRGTVYAEKAKPNNYSPPLLPTTTPGKYSLGRMIRDERWKLVQRLGSGDQFFDLEGKNLEGPNLLEGPLTPEQQAALDELRQELAAVLSG